MPWGLKRFHASGQTHFLTFCCYHRHCLFNTAIPRQVFEAGLERVRRRLDLCVYGYAARAEDWEWSSFRQYATGCSRQSGD